MEFAKVGVPLTAMNVAVYWVFLVYVWANLLLLPVEKYHERASQK